MSRPEYGEIPDNKYKIGEMQLRLEEGINKVLKEHGHTKPLPKGFFSGGSYRADEMKRTLHRCMEYVKSWSKKQSLSEQKVLQELFGPNDIGITARVLSTVWDAAFEDNIGRDLVTVFNQDNPEIKVPIEGRPQWTQIAGGRAGEGPRTGKDYTFTTISAKTFGALIQVPQDTIDDANFSIFERQLRLLGLSYGEFETNRIIDNMESDAGQSQGAASADVVMTDIVAARKKLIEMPNGGSRRPTDLVMSPGFFTEIVKDSNFASMVFHRPDLSGANKMAAAVGFLPGNIRVWEHPAVDNPNALLIARDTAGALLIRQDVNIAEIDDPLKDLVNGKGKARIEYGTLEANSIVKITS